VAQDDYYYEIQLSNKQLVFYFMAGAAGLILSFLAGVMVGRGVDAGAEVQAARPPVEDRILTEEPVARPSQPPAAQDLTYSQRLESDRVDDSLGKPPSAHERPGAAAPRTVRSPEPAPIAAAASPASPPPATAAAAKKPPEAQPAPTKPVPVRSVAPSPSTAGRTASLPKTAGPPAGTFSIQVGAFKDKDSAESMVSRLKGKGYTAFVVSPAGGDGLFNVRVGRFEARADAERIQGKLRDEEKFKPFIVKN